MIIFSEILKPSSKFKISTFIFENFTDFQISYFREKNYQAHGLDSPGLNRIGLKKDMRNDNLSFKRVTDIITPGYPLSIDM